VRCRHESGAAYTLRRCGTCLVIGNNCHQVPPGRGVRELAGVHLGSGTCMWTLVTICVSSRSHHVRTRSINQERCVANPARTVKEAPQCELGPVEHPAIARVRVDAGLGRWVRGQQACDLSWRAVASVHRCACPLRLGRRPMCMHFQESAAFSPHVGLCSIFFPQPGSSLVAAALGQLRHASAPKHLWEHFEA